MNPPLHADRDCPSCREWVVRLLARRDALRADLRAAGAFEELGPSTWQRHPASDIDSSSLARFSALVQAAGRQRRGS